MEREDLLSVDESAGNVEAELERAVSDGDDAPFNTITVECAQGVLTLICC